MNKHLQILNESKFNALETASLFQAGVATDAAREIVVAELVHAVFAGGETGYLANDGDTKLVESPGSTIAAVAALTKRGE